MAKLRGAVFRGNSTDKLPLSLELLIGFADGSHLKLVMMYREKGSVFLILLHAVKKGETKTVVSSAVTNIQVTPVLS